MSFLYSIPPVILLLVAAAMGLLFACGGQLYVHRHFGGSGFVRHNEVGGFIISVVGTLYAVVLGFLTVVVWQHFADARDLVAVEASAAGDAWHTAVGLPPAERTSVRRDMLDYANLMVNGEWPLMRKGEFEPDGDIILMDAIGAAGSFVPANPRESNAQTLTMQQLAAVHDDRSRRLESNTSGVEGFEWLVLLIGATCVVCFCWLFGLANPRAHMLMTAAVTIVVVSILVLLFELQYPFRSHLGVGTDAWRGIINHIQLMQAGPQMNMKM
ncbi:MAG TPA: hypothetical protein VKF82_02575 [Candidatus Eremiobacteraceae bacterium]|nr:hypothetical protein [Candidatus Eremiobacteraceae bacterium]